MGACVGMREREMTLKSSSSPIYFSRPCFMPPHRGTSLQGNNCTQPGPPACLLLLAAPLRGFRGNCHTDKPPCSQRLSEDKDLDKDREKDERRGIQSVPRRRNVPCRQREGLREGEHREKNTGAGTQSSAEHNGRMGERGDKFRERGCLSARASPTVIRAENEIFEPAISAANSITPAACTKSCSFLGPEIEKRQVLMRW
ncbi:hypothetical protein Q8A67_022488 [Cirrhinus molitorella]|uniref:Uncharacterized protein n=1 Tax=Cirrhinus molitorella TaxID=172907 RepID=A0AA88P7X3_9TELE|nr:hypothetical protein Q8A67_022488 [Cirrhinus molitorella]